MTVPIRAVVTGATSGVGRELAVQLAHRGWRVAITGRRADALNETGRLVADAGGEPLVLPGSVTEPTRIRGSPPASETNLAVSFSASARRPVIATRQPRRAS